MNIKRVVGKNVRRYRIEAKLSQKKLAAVLGVEQDYVNRLEAGACDPTIVQIWHAAQALCVRPAAFFRVSPQRSNRKRIWQI
jgi:transcriptional regulator with XRE-family HTH domain